MPVSSSELLSVCVWNKLLFDWCVYHNGWLCGFLSGNENITAYFNHSTWCNFGLKNCSYPDNPTHQRLVFGSIFIRHISPHYGSRITPLHDARDHLTYTDPQLTHPSGQYNENTWAWGFAQWIHKEVHGGGNDSGTIGRGMCFHSDRPPSVLCKNVRIGIRY